MSWYRLQIRDRPFPEACQFLGRDACVAPRATLRADDHALFVALAGQQDDVARAGALEQSANRGAAIDVDVEVGAAAGAGLLGSGRDSIGDGERILLAGIVHAD